MGQGVEIVETMITSECGGYSTPVSLNVVRNLAEELIIVYPGMEKLGIDLLTGE